MKRIVVIAVGGNSLLRASERGTAADMRRNARITCEGIAEVLEAGYRVVLTHGNGPQVGEALLRSESAEPDVRGLGLDECDAETQGSIGYLLQQTLGDVLAERGRRETVATIVTQVLVAASDPAFAHPSKPIGRFYSQQEAREKQELHGWTMVEDAGRGWRRVVPSPRPLRIVELHAIRACLGSGDVVIAAGGGGIPVVRRGRRLEGVDAVIDKDLTSALLAKSLRAEMLLFSTAVPRVAMNFGQPNQLFLDVLTWQQAHDLLALGHFPPGSMGPKIEGAMEFLRAGGRRAVVTCPEQIGNALHGVAGTQVLPMPAPRSRAQYARNAEPETGGHHDRAEVGQAH